MKAITREWLDRAKDDLSAAELLLSQKPLTNIVAFHSQQAVEKSIKAIIEELDIGLVRTHSLIRLYNLIQSYVDIPVDKDMLDRLEAIYLETRYPGDMGLLPYDKPTTNEAAKFYQFSQHIYSHALSFLVRSGVEDSSREEE